MFISNWRVVAVSLVTTTSRSSSEFNREIIDNFLADRRPQIKLNTWFGEKPQLSKFFSLPLVDGTRVYINSIKIQKETGKYKNTCLLIFLVVYVYIIYYYYSFYVLNKTETKCLWIYDRTLWLLKLYMYIYVCLINTSIMLLIINYQIRDFKSLNKFHSCTKLK